MPSIKKDNKCFQYPIVIKSNQGEIRKNNRY